MSFEDRIVEIYPWMKRLSRRYCRCMEDAEDLVNDTVFKMLANRHRFMDHKDLKPWCLVIMQNTYIINYNRKMRFEILCIDSIAHLISNLNAFDRTAFGDVLAVIRKCSKMSLCMESVALYAKGYSYDEISIMVKIPVGTVRSRIYAGRKLLYKLLNM